MEELLWAGSLLCSTLVYFAKQSPSSGCCSAKKKPASFFDIHYCGAAVQYLKSISFDGYVNSVQAFPRAHPTPYVLVVLAEPSYCMKVFFDENNIVSHVEAEPYDKKIKTNAKKQTLSLQILEPVLHLLKCDVTANPSEAPPVIDEEANHFGTIGKDAIMKFKESKYAGQSIPTYYFPFPFLVNLRNECVSVDFDCIIPGKEGRGSEWQYVNLDKGTVYKVCGNRHSNL